jgi:hypothetical protein
VLCLVSLFSCKWPIFYNFPYFSSWMQRGALLLRVAFFLLPLLRWRGRFLFCKRLLGTETNYIQRPHCMWCWCCVLTDAMVSGCPLLPSSYWSSSEAPPSYATVRRLINGRNVLQNASDHYKMLQTATEKLRNCFTYNGQGCPTNCPMCYFTFRKVRIN